jgi:methylated-DNA-[protein]-cysteine S-methyltransferase
MIESGVAESRYDSWRNRDIVELETALGFTSFHIFIMQRQKICGPILSMTRNVLMKLLLDEIHSEIGTILLVANQEALCALDFTTAQQQMMKRLMVRYGCFELERVADPHGFSSLVQAYFEGNYSALDSIPASTGGTQFQQQVWSALRDVTPGIAISYGELAAKLGKPTAARAVGMANALNPVCIVIPCHRVIGANATLTGYSGGLERKQWLLRHEGVNLLHWQNGHPLAQRNRNRNYSDA